MTPFETLYKRPPTFHHLKVFCGKYYATVVHPKQKFEPRTISLGQFLVFSLDILMVTKVTSCMTYNLTNSLSVVKFCEDDFPFSTSSQTLTLASSTPIFPFHDSSYSNIHFPLISTSPPPSILYLDSSTNSNPVPPNT